MRKSLLKPGQNNVVVTKSHQTRQHGLVIIVTAYWMDACLAPGTSLGITIHLLTLQNMKNYPHCLRGETDIICSEA